MVACHGQYCTQQTLLARRGLTRGSFASWLICLVGSASASAGGIVAFCCPVSVLRLRLFGLFLIFPSASALWLMQPRGLSAASASDSSNNHRPPLVGCGGLCQRERATTFQAHSPQSGCNGGCLTEASKTRWLLFMYWPQEENPIYCSLQG